MHGVYNRRIANFHSDSELNMYQCHATCDGLVLYQYWDYRKTSNISRTLVGNTIVDNSDVVGASPVGAAPTTSSFST